MADTKTTNEIAADAFAGPEEFYVVQGGADRKGSATQMATYVFGGAAQAALFSVFAGPAAGTPNAGTGNTGVGANVLGDGGAGATGGYNTAIGDLALANLTTGNGNSAFGAYALRDTTSGVYNTAMGEAAGFQISTGGHNTLVGQYAGGQIADGSYNTVVGSGGAGNTITSGSHNIVIGDSISVPDGAADNQINIGGEITGVRGVGLTFAHPITLPADANQGAVRSTYYQDFSATFGAITALTGSIETVTVTGLLTTDQVHLECISAPTSGMIIANVRVSADDTLEVYIVTAVALGITLGALNFRLTVIR